MTSPGASRRQETLVWLAAAWLFPALLPFFLLGGTGVSAAQAGAAPHPELPACAAGTAPERAAGSVAEDLKRIYLHWPQVSPAEGAAGLAAVVLTYGRDQELYDWVQRHRTAELSRWSATVTQLGSPAFTLTAPLLLAALDPETGYLGFNAVALADIWAVSLKWAVGSSRPRAGEGHRFRPGQGWVNGDHDSFPSGHTAAAFALADVLAHRYPDGAALFYAGAAAVGYSRVYEKAHWPSDVVAGALLGLLASRQVRGSSRLFDPHAETVLPLFYRTF
ncbi:MAG: phosphatase PAP2 family protein [Firmicutes bacterium]|nr:phosphatase PAP2 family protein [Bacillota bacterium]